MNQPDTYPHTGEMDKVQKHREGVLTQESGDRDGQGEGPSTKLSPCKQGA